MDHRGDSVPGEFDHAPLGRVVCVANRKGGVGKTSLTANLGGLLAEAGWKVLIIDLDPQGNLGEDLGYTATALDDLGAGLSDCLSATSPQPLRPQQTSRPNLSVVPGGSHLTVLDQFLSLRQIQCPPGQVQLALARAIAPIASDYDLILIDTPPAIQQLQLQALSAARWLLIPTRTDISSRKGLGQVVDLFTQARTVNPTLEVMGVILFGITAGASAVKARARADLAADLGGEALLFSTTIRYAERPSGEARSRGLLVHELEVAAAAVDQPFWTHLRKPTNPAVPSEAPPTRLGSASLGTLAGDYQQVAHEFLTRLLSEPQPAK